MFKQDRLKDRKLIYICSDDKKMPKKNVSWTTVPNKNDLNNMPPKLKQLVEKYINNNYKEQNKINYHHYYDSRFAIISSKGRTIKYIVHNFDKLKGINIETEKDLKEKLTMIVYVKNGNPSYIIKDDYNTGLKIQKEGIQWYDLY